MSAPSGIPWAIFEIFTSVPSNNFLIYKAVVSPSTLGFMASIT